MKPFVQIDQFEDRLYFLLHLDIQGDDEALLSAANAIVDKSFMAHMLASDTFFKDHAPSEYGASLLLPIGRSHILKTSYCGEDQRSSHQKMREARFSKASLNAVIDQSWTLNFFDSRILVEALIVNDDWTLESAVNWIEANKGEADFKEAFARLLTAGSQHLVSAYTTNPESGGQSYIDDHVRLLAVLPRFIEETSNGAFTRHVTTKCCYADWAMYDLTQGLEPNAVLVRATEDQIPFGNAPAKDLALNHDEIDLEDMVSAIFP